MSIFDPNSGFTGTPDPLRFAWGQQAIEDARRAAQGASLDLWPDADFIFIDPLTGQPRLPQAIEDVATVIRGSKSWSDGWSGVNGDLAGPLIEHASGKASWAPSGLTVSPAVENLITNPRGEGAAVPAVPSAWDVGGTATIALSGRGTQDGWPYVEFTINGTGSAYATPGYYSVASGDVLTGSAGLALVSGSTTAAPATLTLSTDGGQTGANASAAVSPIHRRWSFTKALTGSPTIAGLAILFPEGTYSNAVIRIFTPQLTKTAYPARPVLPPAGTSGAATRAVESVTVPIGDWYRHDEGTLVVEYDRSLLANRGIVALPEPGTGGFGRAIRFSDGNLIVLVEASRLSTLVVGSEPFNSGPRNLTALRWSGSAHKGANNGVLGAGFTLASSVLAPTDLFLGTGGLAQGIDNPSATPIHRVRFFPRALTDAEMIDVTTPYWSA